MTTPPTVCRPRSLPVSLVAACLLASSGCTSVISSAYLRDTWLDRLDHASRKEPAAEREPESDRDDDADASGAFVTDEATASDPEFATAAESPASLEDAVAAAAERLRPVGGLTAAARATLVDTLASTPRQDWPVVIDEFAAALVMAHEAPLAAAAPPDEGAAVAAVAKLPAAPASGPVADSVAAPPSPASEESVPPAGVAESFRDPAPPAQAPREFTVQNACFASRVRAWGVVDRFETSAFRRGQEVIVYFELDEIASRESADGHTTRIDTRVRLVGADGRGIHDWTFEPLEETCGNRRRDYFARYLLTVPESAPAGQCRLELAVSDMIGARTAHATLPLEVLPR